jgi:hypothetical protein
MRFDSTVTWQHVYRAHGPVSRSNDRSGQMTEREGLEAENAACWWSAERAEPRLETLSDADKRYRVGYESSSDNAIEDRVPDELVF